MMECGVEFDYAKVTELKAEWESIRSLLRGVRQPLVYQTVYIAELTSCEGV